MTNGVLQARDGAVQLWRLPAPVIDLCCYPRSHAVTHCAVASLHWCASALRTSRWLRGGMHPAWATTTTTGV